MTDALKLMLSVLTTLFLLVFVLTILPKDVEWWRVVVAMTCLDMYVTFDRIKDRYDPPLKYGE